VSQQSSDYDYEEPEPLLHQVSIPLSSSKYPDEYIKQQQEGSETMITDKHGRPYIYNPDDPAQKDIKPPPFGVAAWDLIEEEEREKEKKKGGIVRRLISGSRMTTELIWGGNKSRKSYTLNYFKPEERAKRRELWRARWANMKSKVTYRKAAKDETQSPESNLLDQPDGS